MFLLWQFETNEGTQATRGRSEQEARQYLEEICKLRVLHAYGYCTISAAYQYSVCHPFDWLTAFPRWLKRDAPWISPNPAFKNQFYPATL